MQLSHLAENLSGSPLLSINNTIKKKISQGEQIINLTIGDFDPAVFPVPQLLKQEIIKAYEADFTNYPAAEGNADLRAALSAFIQQQGGFRYSDEEILVASGGRPLIYAVHRAVCDPGDGVIYAVPSWNSAFYTDLVGGDHRIIITEEGANFLPTAAQIKPLLHGAALLSLCSPQNPSGTVFSREALREIGSLVMEENRQRGLKGEKPLYILYDQMYRHLVYDGTAHYDPVTLCPGLRPYTIFVDAISKCFAATGLRVGWGYGPVHVMAKMKAILSHVGAWAPMPEQKGLARFLQHEIAVTDYLNRFGTALYSRLFRIYKEVTRLKEEGFPVDALAPQASVFMSVKIDLAGSELKDGTVLRTQEDVTRFLLDKGGLGLLPLSVFGADEAMPWYRLSVGTLREEEVAVVMERLGTCLRFCKSENTVLQF